MSVNTAPRAARTTRAVLPPLTAAEYFAGVGLVRMGLARAGWEVVFANDWDVKKVPMYRAFFPEEEAHYTTSDIFEMRPQDVPHATLATCSFPCIDLSLAGKQRGINGADSGAFWGFLNIIKAHGSAAPQVLLLENVPGLLTANGGQDLAVLAKALGDLGYRCDIFTLNALHFVPQSRLRVFIIAARGDGLPPFDAKRFFERDQALAPRRLQEAVLAVPTLAGMTLDLPSPPPLLRDGLNQTVIESIAPKNPLWWDAEKVARHLDMMSPQHRQYIEAFRHKSRFVYRTFYRRRRAEGQRAEVRQDDIAGCLRTVSGGSGRQFLVVAGRGKIKMRSMTAREYARLQGVPDKFAIASDEKTAMSAFGDAVCVPAIEWIARKVLNPLVETLDRQGKRQLAICEPPPKPRKSNGRAARDAAYPSAAPRRRRTPAPATRQAKR